MKIQQFQWNPQSLSFLLLPFALASMILSPSLASTWHFAQRTVVLTVRVVDSSDNAVSGAHVVVSQGNQRLGEQVTDDQGIARLNIEVRDNQALNPTIEVSHVGMATKRNTVDFGTAFPDRLPLQTFTLKPGGPVRTVLLTVRVTDAEGKKINQAHINVYYQTFRANSGLVVVPPTYQRDTNQEGLARFDLEAEFGKALPVSIEVAREDMQTQKHNIEISKDDQLDDYFQEFQLLPRSKDADNLPSATIRVQVFEDSGTKDSDGKPQPGPPLAGALVSTKVLVGATRWNEHQAVTGGDGYATLMVELTSADSQERFRITASKQGFNPNVGPVEIDNKYQRAVGKTFDASPILLSKQAHSVDAVEVKVKIFDGETNNGVPGAEVVLNGPDFMTRTSDDNGTATFSVDKPGQYSISVAQDNFFSTKDGEIRIVRGVTPEPVEFRLRHKPDKDAARDTIEVTVLGRDTTDPKSKPGPVPGAFVSDGRGGVATDNDGKATLIGAFDLPRDITVQATGYKTQSRRVGVAKVLITSAGTGSATFILDPDLTENSPIRLIVEVIDASGNKIDKAAVTFKAIDDSFLWFGNKGHGEESYYSGDTPSKPLAAVRKGIKLDVRADGYDVVNDHLVTPNFLEPSLDARRFVVQLNRSSDALRTAIDALEPRVFALQSDVTAAVKTVNGSRDLLDELVKAAPQTNDRINALAKEIESIATRTNVEPGVDSCRAGERLRNSIQTAGTKAAAQEQSLRSLLDQSAGLAQQCTDPKNPRDFSKDLQTAYRTAVDLARQIRELDKQAAKDNQELAKLADSRKYLISDIAAKLDELQAEALKAQTAASNAKALQTRAAGLIAPLKPRNASLTGELAALKKTFGLPQNNSEVPLDLRQRIDTVTQLLSSQNSILARDYSASVSEVEAVAANASSKLGSARQILEKYRQNGPQCNLQPMDNVVEEMDAIVASSTIELAAAALNEKAQACVNKNSCNADLTQARRLLEEGAIDPAQGIIRSAAAKGCDVTNINEELDYWKTVVDGAAYIKGMEGACRFRDAYEWSLKLPASIRNRPLMAKVIAENASGMKAQERIAQLRDQAKAEVDKTGRPGAAAPFITEAESLAAPYDCLKKEAAEFRKQYKGGASPADPGIATAGAIFVVEEIPNDAIKTKPPTPPEVEDLPDTDNAIKKSPQVTSSKSGGKGDIPLGVRPCTADELSAFSKLTGTWGVGGAKITISGSCEQVTGGTDWAEYCGDPDNTTYAKYHSTFKGHMEGSTLQVNWDLPAQGPHDAYKGNGSCSLNSDGSLNCTGFRCGVGGKRK